MYDERQSSSLPLDSANKPNPLRTSRFSSLGSPRSGPLRLRFEGSTMRSRRTLAVSLTWKRPSQWLTIRGNVETYIQHLVPATDLRQFSDRMSGSLNKHSPKHEEHKLQLSRIARCVKDLHDGSQGPNPKDMQAQVMKLVLRVNEINMQLRERPPAAMHPQVVALHLWENRFLSPGANS